MSVQLILYPQNQATTNEFLVNGINFTGLSTATLHNTTAASPSQDAIINSPPTIPNTWYRYTTSSGTWGGVAPPIYTSALLLFYNVTAGRTGIYQKLSGLTIGQSYTVTINISTSAVGVLRLETYTGSILQSTTSASSNTTQVTASFTANSANDTILLEYQSVSGLLYISDISVMGSLLVPSDTYEGQVIVDLYEDEDIPLTLSIDNFKNVAEKVQSYSKSFNLPATKRNNQIFTNLFEVTMVQDAFSFNPYIKTPCVLKQNGFILFEGYLRLIDIQDKEAEISYNVNLYSEVIALKDVLENKTFQDMGFSELEHEYNRLQVGYSWNDSGTGITYTNPSTSGFRDAFSTVKYPFVDWNHQYTVNATSGNPILPDLESSFRPFINIKYLLDRIFADTDFTWTSNFFNTTDFGKLYMDFNWGGDGFVSADSIYNAKWDKVGGVASNVGTGSFKALRLIPESVEPLLVGSTVPPNYQTTGVDIYKIVATTTNEMYNISYNFKLQNTSGLAQTCQCRWIHKIGGVAQPPINPMGLIWIGGGGQSYIGSFNIALNTGDTLEAQFNGNSNIEQDETFESSAIFTQSSGFVNSAGLLTLRGELGQWDFLKGLMTMFNLVSLPDKDNPNNITFEPYNDIFITDPNIVTHDWTDKVDVSEMKLTPLTELNKTTIFKFVEDDDDYAFNVYKNSVGGHLYGSKVYDASGLTLLQGTDEIVAEPFAATVVKPLMSQFPEFITPAIYSMNEDGTSEGFDNSPRIMYNNGIKNIGVSYYIPAQNGLSAVSIYTALQFSHLSTIPTATGTLDFHFGECQLIQGVGNPTALNLFNLYWLPYYSELYNPNTRTMSLKVALNPSDINTFKFNDKVFIKNRNYRVNKIDYKPNDLATVEFILIP